MKRKSKFFESLAKKINKARDDAEKARMRGEPVCWCCDKKIAEGSIVKSGKYELLAGLFLDIYWCLDCSNYAQEFENESGEPLLKPGADDNYLTDAEKKQKRELCLRDGQPILTCSFCGSDQFDQRHLFSVRHFYKVYEPDGSFNIYPAAPRGFDLQCFFTQFRDKKIEKISELIICGKCALGGS